MGIFHEMMEVVNRCPWPLSIRFDGQESTLAPGKNSIPKTTLFYALNQNPLMGSQDADNPSVSGAEYLIGIPGDEKYPCDPLTKDQIEQQTSKPSRYDYEELINPRLGKRDKIEIKGRKKVSTYDAKEPSLVGTDRND
jgi:hypothetical protein